ncbi:MULTISPECIES: hypothetical protein [Streptomyces]|uniref:Uncharacterized protein n=2 Tax=Streptomyces TaxID=1883 RepID=A0ABV9IN67_9ACTN
MSRLVMGAAAATLASAVVLAAMAVLSPPDDVHRRHVPVVIEAGAVCASLSDRRYEVSCGTTAFGDLRFNCTGGGFGKCPPTTAVTLRNTGRTSVSVTMVSGRREGDRRLSPAPELAPGRTVTLSKRPDEKYFFDILLRSIKPGVGTVKVVSVA